MLIPTTTTTLLLSWEHLPDSVLYPTKAETLTLPPLVPTLAKLTLQEESLNRRKLQKENPRTVLNHKASSIAFVLRGQQNGWAAPGDLADGKLIRDASFRERACQEFGGIHCCLETRDQIGNRKPQEKRDRNT